MLGDKAFDPHLFDEGQAFELGKPPLRAIMMAMLGCRWKITSVVLVHTDSIVADSKKLRLMSFGSPTWLNPLLRDSTHQRSQPFPHFIGGGGCHLATANCD